MNPATWIADLWNNSSASLKKVLAACLIMFAGVTAYLLWSSGYTVNRLDGMLTRDDLQQQTDTLQATTEGVADQVNEALSTYDDSLKSYLRAERKLAVDTTLKPLVKMLFSLSNKVDEIQSVQRTTQSTVNRLPAQYEGALQRIIQDQPPSRTDALLEQLLDNQRRQQQQLDSLMKTKARTNKQKF